MPGLRHDFARGKNLIGNSPGHAMFCLDSRHFVLTFCNSSELCLKKFLTFETFPSGGFENGGCKTKRRE